MMFLPVFLIVCSFALSLTLTPVLREMARRIGWLDEPDSKRKLHTVPVPRIGGIPIYIAYAVSLLLLVSTPLHEFNSAPGALQLVWRIFPAATIIFLTGLVDDIIGLKPRQKIACELAAAAVACWAGVRIGNIAGHTIGHWWAVPITIVWLLACTNAFNLIDGTDGVASGVGLFATLTMFVAALLRGDFGLVLASAPLAGALLGFLRYNFNPASVFLGDAGSLWIGFVLGCYGVMWSQKSVTMLGMTAPLMALAIPLLDTSLAIVRRFLRRRPIFGADRGHIHHRLLDRGLTPRRVALLLYGASGLAACFAVLQTVVRQEFGGVILVLFCAAAWSGVQCLGYHELGIAARLLRLTALRAQVDEQIRLRSFEESLAAAETVDGCWLSVRDAARELGFSSVTLKFGGACYEERLEKCERGAWLLRIPLSDSAFIDLTRKFRSEENPLTIASFADSLHRILEKKTCNMGNDAAFQPAPATEANAPGAVLSPQPELQWTASEVR